MIRRNPKTLQAHEICQKKGLIPGSQNKSWEFGGHALSKNCRCPSNINFWYYACFQYKAPRGSYDDINIDLFLPLTLRKIFPQVEKSKVKIGV